MKLDSEKQAVFVSRTFDIDVGGHARHAQLTIFSPYCSSDGNWLCKYRVTGIPEISENEYAIVGVDSLQAIRNSFKAIEGLLAGTDASKSGCLRWLNATSGYTE